MAQPGDAGVSQRQQFNTRDVHPFSVEDRQPTAPKAAEKAVADPGGRDNACFPKTSPWLESLHLLKPGEVDPRREIKDPPEQMRRWLTPDPKDPLREIKDPPEQMRRWVTPDPKDPLREIKDPPEQMRRWVTHDPKDPLSRMTDPPWLMRHWFTVAPTVPPDRLREIKDPPWKPGIAHPANPADPLHLIVDPPVKFRDPPGESQFRVTPELRRQLQLLVPPTKPVVCD